MSNPDVISKIVTPKCQFLRSDVKFHSQMLNFRRKIQSPDIKRKNPDVKRSNPDVKHKILT